MLASNALIGLREGLEAALVVVILIAFLVKTDRRRALKYVWLGVGTAVALSVALGAALTFGAQGLAHETQELIGGISSIIAVAFVTGMVFWMRAASKTISGDLKSRLARALDLGPLAVAAVGFVGVGREGLETAIFFFATTEAAGQGNVQPLLGWVIGLGAAVLLGVLIYRGAVRINLTKFFRYTGILLIVVAAGILAYGVHDLQEAGVLPGEGLSAFDIRAVVLPGAWYAVLLKGMFNITPVMSVFQVVAWALYVGVVLTIFLRPLHPAVAVAPSVEPQRTRAA
ncbi:MAG TPA: iron uptake transporter permease EfeU [Intrasporangium sp.]|nr:iron uptake transporter permease EfeU [Intrasporangium sp.]